MPDRYSTVNILINLLIIFKFVDNIYLIIKSK